LEPGQRGVGPLGVQRKPVPAGRGRPRHHGLGQAGSGVGVDDVAVGGSMSGRPGGDALCLGATVGSGVAVATGTLLAAAGLATQAVFIDGSSYAPTGMGLLLFGLGAGIAMPSATDVIMATLPPARAGVGSAVNDTVRELGGALGVAVIGSVAATSYTSTLRADLNQFPELTDPVRAGLTDNIGAAIDMSHHIGPNGNEIASLARTAFVESMSGALWLSAAAAIGATIIALVYLPRDAKEQSAERTHGHASHHPSEMQSINAHKLS